MLSNLLFYSVYMLYWRVLTLPDPARVAVRKVSVQLDQNERKFHFFLFFLEVIKIPIVYSICDVCNIVNIKIFADAVQVKTIVKA